MPLPDFPYAASNTRFYLIQDFIRYLPGKFVLRRVCLIFALFVACKTPFSSHFNIALYCVLAVLKADWTLLKNSFFAPPTVMSFFCVQ